MGKKKISTILKERIRDLINELSLDNEWGVPDYVLADFLVESLFTFRMALADMKKHEGPDSGDVIAWTSAIGENKEGRYAVCSGCKSKMNLEEIYKKGLQAKCPICGLKMKPGMATQLMVPKHG